MTRAEEEGRYQTKKTAERLVQILDMNAPSMIVAREGALLLEALTLLCGKEFYECLGELAISKVRQRFAFCQHCDSPISSQFSFPPICENCDAREEENYQKMKEELKDYEAE